MPSWLNLCVVLGHSVDPTRAIKIVCVGLHLFACVGFCQVSSSHTHACTRVLKLKLGRLLLSGTVYLSLPHAHACRQSWVIFAWGDTHIPGCLWDSSSIEMHNWPRSQVSHHHQYPPPLAMHASVQHMSRLFHALACLLHTWLAKTASQRLLQQHRASLSDSRCDILSERTCINALG